MKVKKRMAALIPTVQYGNVSIEIEAEKEAGDTKEEQLKTGVFLNKYIVHEYKTFYKELSELGDVLTTLD